MKKYILAALLAIAALSTVPAAAKVHIVPKPQTCVRGNDTLAGITNDQCKLLNDFDDGKIMRGCLVRGSYVRGLSEDDCNVLDGLWTWVRT